MLRSVLWIFLVALIITMVFASRHLFRHGAKYYATNKLMFFSVFVSYLSSFVAGFWLFQMLSTHQLTENGQCRSNPPITFGEVVAAHS